MERWGLLNYVGCSGGSPSPTQAQKKKTINLHHNSNNKHKNDFTHLKNIKKKLKLNNAIITKADKGNTVVVMNQSSHQEKVYKFIENNNIKKVQHDPTEKYNEEINASINRSEYVLNKASKFYLKTIKPRAPELTGLPKTHKEEISIRPVNNYTTAPGYKTSKKLYHIINDNIKFEKTYSIKNNIEFIKNLNNFKTSTSLKMISLDIVNLYTNIPLEETLTILKENLIKNIKTNNLSKPYINELIQLLRTVLSQNYFTFNNEFFIQQEGLATGSPLSGLLAEIYLNHFEQNYIFSNNNKFSNSVKFYNRYVDDTFILIQGSNRQIENFKNYLNGINKNIQFTLEIEENNKINFLELTVYKAQNEFKLKIFRKPTTTDITIHATSHHPISQKMAAYNSFVHKLLTIPMEPSDYEEELNIIKQIAVANGYKSSTIDKLIYKQQKKKKHQLLPNDNIKYLSTTYGNITNQILVEVFEKLNIKVAFKTDNNIRKILRFRTPGKPEKLECKSGIYKIECNDYDSIYIGQTGRSFSKRFAEHIPGPNQKVLKSNYAKHLLTSKHTGTILHENLTPLHFCNKSNLMDALEEFEIYKAFSKNENMLIEQLKFKSDILYDTAIKILEINK